MSLRTEKAYLHWIRRYVRPHGRRSPRELDAEHVEALLTLLATEGHVAASTRNQALCAILFFYERVLKMDLPWLANVARATRPRHLPVVLSPVEVRRVLAELKGTSWLMASLLYGSGVRLQECLALRVNDIDLERREITVHDGKGRKDRVTTLPETLRAPPVGHLARLREWFDNERRLNRPGVSLPLALERQYPSASTSWAWQYLFPSSRTCIDPYGGRGVRSPLDRSAAVRARGEA